MRKIGIKYQILLLTLVPVFLIDLFFTYAHISNSIAQEDELLQSKGQIIARQIAGASEFNLLAGEHSQIQYLLAQAVDTNNIVLASVYDQQGTLIAESKSISFQQVIATDYLYNREPILSRGVEVTDVLAPKVHDTRQAGGLGWVHLYISRQQLQQTINSVVVDSIVFFVSILLMAAMLTVIISRRITQPIFRLMEHLKYVETGELGKTVKITEANEIGALQQGFNQMSNALLTNRNHLNRRIQQATQQLNEAIAELENRNRELGFARDEAQNANQTKSEFLANMSHEIRTPINGIKGFISLLNQSKLDHAQQRYVDIVLKSTGDLSNIIDEILDFSKMESGKLHIVEEEFDLHEVIEQTRDILFINVLTKNIDLNLIIYSDTPRRVVGDKLRLKQILLNLIGNAIKFTDQGRVVVKVSLLDIDDDDHHSNIEITVEDTGIGISEQEQQTLFQAFSQVESSATRRFAGTGLGLVISKNLATLMGGDIKMQSSPGKGSKFTLQMVFQIADTTDAPLTAPANIPNALILGVDKYCLMEARTLFDRAGTSTETSIIHNSDGVDPVKQCIQRNLAYIDLLVIDSRHLHINLEDLLDQETIAAVRIILLHYDQVVEPPAMQGQLEFISVISTSQAVSHLLARQTTPTPPDNVIDIPKDTPVKSVLLVDDHPVNLKLATELIRLWGHEVTPADHGSKALELFNSQHFDLIILDIQMPDIDGVSLLHMMRQQQPDDQTPVVALTANVLNDEAGRLIELGFDYFLGKPIDEDKFRGLLSSDTSRQQANLMDTVSAGKELDCSVDYVRSLALSAGNESLLKQIFEILQRDIPDQQVQLASALAQRDHDRLSAIAHKLHGVTCYASLPRLRHKVLGFEQRLARDSDAPLDLLVQELRDELEAIKQEVDSYLEKPDAASAWS